MIRFTGFTFDPNFKEKSKANFERTQKYIDSETLKWTEMYMPKRTGTLVRSGIQGTVIGSGILEYKAPYARNQYYTNAGRGIDGINAVKGTKGLRGPYGFERMKADHKDDILKGIQK